MRFEHGAHLERDAPDVFPTDIGARIQIDAQLIGVIEIGAAHGVRMQFDTAEVHDPGQRRRVVDHQLLCRAPRGERQHRRNQPFGPLFWGALLIEGWRVGAVDEALEHDRPLANAEQRALGDAQIIAHDVQLGEPHLLREVQLARVRDGHRVAVDRQLFGFRVAHSGALLGQGGPN